MFAAPYQHMLESQRIQQIVAEMLKKEFNIGHSTIQLEVEVRETDSQHCDLRSSADEHSECGQSQ
jgi:hypothetical protein